MAAPAALQRLARRALLTTAKADTALTALVPATSIAPDGTPTWPFVLVEAPRTSRLRAACVRGATVAFDLHAFAGPRLADGAEVETGYDHCSRIAACLEALFAETRLTLEGGAVARVTLSDAMMLKDGDPDAWHWTAQANCRILA